MRIQTVFGTCPCLLNAFTVIARSHPDHSSLSLHHQHSGREAEMPRSHSRHGLNVNLLRKWTITI